jgi:riboflavin kinase/FMN adenylyltransferase
MFDGVHRGHRRVIHTLVNAAAERDAAPVVLTFDPHPAKLLRGEAPALICDPEERLARLDELGVATVVVQRFDRAFADQPAAEFLTRVRDGRTLAGLVMTAESAFGRDRAGGLPQIRTIARELGFDTIEVPRLATEGMTLSSTRIRGLIEAGRLSEASRSLGRRYAVIGTVVRGDRRGRELGYPTANLAFEEPVALPPNGIYAVRAGWGGRSPLAPNRRADGVASLGVRPTFGGGARVLEVYLFDVDEDLYGNRLRVELVRRLRGERRFPSADALVRQMDRDADRALAVLSTISA